jgi:phage tail-like protein
MRVSAGLPMAAALCVTATIALTTPGLSQAPTAENQPQLVKPAPGAVVRQAPTAVQEAAPAAQPPGQPTAAPAPESVTQVTAPAAGVTQLPNSTATAPTSSSSQAATADYRSYGGSRFALSLDGIQAGPVSGVEGGTPTADVVVERLGPDNIAHKHVGGLRYQDLSFTTGLDSKALNDWISATLKGQYARKNGSVIAMDYSNRPSSELEFFNALITGITFPALDAASKDAASIAVSLAPEYTRAKAGSGTSASYASKSLKRWTPANFRFEMTGLDGTHVNHIDAITIGQQVTENTVGENRDYEKAPSRLEIPNVKLTMSENYAQSWANWLDDFLIKGNNGQDKEREGSIAYLDSSMQELGRLHLFGCGIVGLGSQKSQAKTETIRRVQAELYCERMELETK